MTDLEEKAHETLLTTIWGGFQDEGQTLADLIGRTFVASIGGATGADEPKVTACGTILAFSINMEDGKGMIATSAGTFVHHAGDNHLCFETGAILPQKAWLEWPGFEKKK